MIHDRIAPPQLEKFAGATVLIAGGAGTIGSVIARLLSAVCHVVVVDLSEYSTYKLRRELPSATYIVGDIGNPVICDSIFSAFSIDYVFNAAAYKHVDLLESPINTISAVINNLQSALTLCKYSTHTQGIYHISSDKAANPVSTMGLTKLWCERVFQLASHTTDASVKIVRFGNVFNSSGSFVETLQWQLASGRPVTLTDERMKRYFITINDAVSLITTVALDDNFTNATYVLDMGEEIPIVDIIRHFNTTNQPVEVIGSRAGEKLSEVLVSDGEKLVPTHNPNINRVDWSFDRFEVAQKLSSIIHSVEKGNVNTELLKQ